MSWLALTIALGLTYVLQTAVVWTLGWSTVDLFLTLTLIVAFLAPRFEARLAALAIGLVQDLGSQGALGPHAFALGLTALLLTRAADIVNFDALAPRCVAAFFSAWAGQLVLWAYHIAWVGAEASLARAAFNSLAAAAIAAALSGCPLSIPPLWRFRRRVQTAHRRARY